ncbi:hypothetical protein NC653_009348 [Populus alba x Populus x berolinensis]|uniref:Uncharacterized protein n=1 Tax=Populus alba x Populus x berolinensis TaxID=444605 RepID=A0AAD6R963_9ROSI|nr:hypothetical protein NC653_009348 [Populus alba x Populus x berolinensis]
MLFNDVLQKSIAEEYLRFEPYLKNACRRFVMELSSTFISDDNPNKIKRANNSRNWETGVSTGVVTCTSAELLGVNLECGGVVKNVEQQFKYTEPTICTNATCTNEMRWALLRQENKFADRRGLECRKLLKRFLLVPFPDL